MFSRKLLKLELGHLSLSTVLRLTFILELLNECSKTAWTRSPCFVHQKTVPPRFGYEFEFCENQTFFMLKFVFQKKTLKRIPATSWSMLMRTVQRKISNQIMTMILILSRLVFTFSREPISAGIGKMKRTPSRIDQGFETMFKCFICLL